MMMNQRNEIRVNATRPTVNIITSKLLSATFSRNSMFHSSWAQQQVLLMVKFLNSSATVSGELIE